MRFFTSFHSRELLSCSVFEWFYFRDIFCCCLALRRITNVNKIFWLCPKTTLTCRTILIDQIECFYCESECSKTLYLYIYIYIQICGNFPSVCKLHRKRRFVVVDWNVLTQMSTILLFFFVVTNITSVCMWCNAHFNGI